MAFAAFLLLARSVRVDLLLALGDLSPASASDPAESESPDWTEHSSSSVSASPLRLAGAFLPVLVAAFLTSVCMMTTIIGCKLDYSGLCVTDILNTFDRKL